MAPDIGGCSENDNMKTKLTKWMGLVSTSTVISLLLCGCAWQIGGDKHGTSVATRGQELIDLKKAKDQGVITEAEYQAQRNKILEK